MAGVEESVTQINSGDAHDFRSLLSSSERDFLVRNNGDQVKIDILKGKKLWLYFSASWCGPCRQFTPTLVKVYNELSPRGEFEIIFVSADEDEESFNGYFSKMPWLAIPFSDSETRDRLDEVFKVEGIPTLVIIDEDGKVVSDSGVEIIGEHGIEGYPFTQERMKELKDQEEAELKEMKGWPEKLKHKLHEEHELVLARRITYTCDGCDEPGNVWSYSCDECDFDLHTKCALEEGKGAKDNSKVEENAEEGWVCDGEMCYKASENV